MALAQLKEAAMRFCKSLVTLSVGNFQSVGVCSGWLALVDGSALETYLLGLIAYEELVGADLVFEIKVGLFC